MQNLLRLLEDNRVEGDETANANLRSHIGGLLCAEQLWMTGFAPCKPNDPVVLATALTEFNSIVWENGYPQQLRSQPPAAQGVRFLSREEIEAALNQAAAEESIPAGAEKSVAISLMRVSGAFARVGELYKAAVPLWSEVGLRAANGVDADLSGLDDVLFAHEVGSFTADPTASARVAYAERHDWERRFFEAAACLGRARGEKWRTRAQGVEAAERLIDILRRTVFPHLGFSLSERARWEEAYHLPEHVVPRLMVHAAEAIAECEPESSAAFAELLLDSPQTQLGLYTEGYQRVLRYTANILAATPAGTQPAADLRRALRRHIVGCVFARHERVEGLLDCAQHFSRLGALEDAEGAFQEAIQASLGPGWYKEDQFRLLLDCLEAVNNPEFSLAQWRKVVELLAIASGESTFQRYIRQQKERLIEHLSQHGFLAEAFATYRLYVLPSFQLQRSRVLRVDVDMTSALSGSRFGVLEVDEQAATIALVSGMADASPRKLWAVIELFWPWGDTRYAGEFVGLLCRLLESGEAAVIGERFVRLLRAEVDPDRRAGFIADILQFDKKKVVGPWIQAARDRGIIAVVDQVATEPPGPEPHNPPVASSQAQTENEEMYLPGVFGRSNALEPLRQAKGAAQERLRRNDPASARLTLIGALRQAQTGGWNIWEGHPDVDSALACLFGQCGPLGVVLQTVAGTVLAEPYASNWKVAAKLIVSAAPYLEPTVRTELFSVIAEHIECLVGVEREHSSVAGEIDELPSAPDPVSIRC